MSNSLMENKADDVPSEQHSVLPQQITVLQAADIPKASPEALNLLKSIGKHSELFYVHHIFATLLLVY